MLEKLLLKINVRIIYFRNIYLLYKKIWALDKFYVFNSILIVGMRAAHPFNSVLFLKWIVDELTGPGRWTQSLLLVGLMCVIELVLRSLDGIFWTYEQKKILLFKTDFLKEINLKTMSLSYQQIEEPKLIDDRQKAMEIFYPGQAHFMDLKNTIIDSKQLVANTLQFIGVITILIMLGPYIFFALLVTYFISVVLNTIAADKEFNVWSHSLVNIGRRIGYFQELSTDFTYAKEMRINRLGQWIVDKMQYYFKNMRKDVTKAVHAFTFMSMISNTLQVLVNGGVYFYIGWLAYRGLVSVSEIVVYITSLGVFVAALFGISACIISLQKAGMHLSTYFTYLKTVSSNELTHTDTDFISDFELNSDQIEIEFVDVWFQYPNQEHFTIKSLNLTILPNEKLAIVGENGAGKTTLVKLLLRFYKPTRGHILLNGIDIHRISLDDYMKNITAVFQDFNILNFSLLDNLVFDQEYQDNEIAKIINSLNLNKTVENLPKQLETELGRLFNQNGIELSGGQQQKLAIARALFRDCPLVILDEPTAMLSPKAEYEIYSNFSELTQNKTTVYISHRMSSCRFCHRIVVMSRGEMVELGSHEQLIQEKGEYYRLYTTQAEFYKNLEVS
ncbi:ABC transporter ATP-binding protein [Paenibacillus sp. OK003]|uniref:ABC transporter ATP-binding protein n=1 Tax=Paenibacillus sp. OK003 TaxID=1884380 RepID=UPI0008BF606C|nr:ABC transporter ATP-binding protein [Paenibacillus sp. OK003]SEL55264.1 ATP-binding cassette, subfamily B/ATP-binding cassette, subfamily C [Paenibacillus sp. OK003]